MTKTFTPNELIRYYYKETSEKENRNIQNALICDPLLQEQYKEISKIIRLLDKVKFDPSDRVIKTILNYSRNTDVHSLNK
jgi:hypothetical protein